jgi:hypothetical protein
MIYRGITEVEAAEDHRLLLRFDNGERRVFDVKPLLATGRFRELVAHDEFRKVRVAFDTVEWANGLDLDPEYLYERSEALDAERVKVRATKDQATKEASTNYSTST